MYITNDSPISGSYVACLHEEHRRLADKRDQQPPTMDRIPPQARSKHLRACLLCSIIQLPAEFRKSGCPNCEEILQVRICRHTLIQSAHPIMQMKGSQDRITSCTTTQFDGVISVIDPDNSWVARWQRTGPFDFPFRSSANRSRTNFSKICPRNICCPRYWTYTRRR